MMKVTREDVELLNKTARGLLLKPGYKLDPSSPIYDLIPMVENIDQKTLAEIEADKGKLVMGDWHTCNTTHCLAGWAIHHAGKEGYALEELTEPEYAGALIYAKSCPTLPIPNFYSDDEEGMEQLRERAGKGC